MTLPEDYIRLVSIFSANDTNDTNDLRLSREHTRPLPSQSTQQLAESGTQQHEPYIALSYTWGPQAVDLVCDGTVHQVSSNLPPALTSLHRNFPGRLVWTDTLSINQQDAGEKRYQVGIMGRIFSQADVVAVWLGDEATGIYEELLTLADTSPDDAQASKRRIVVLAELARCAWFYRAWTFQEIRLATKAIALIGASYVKWTELISVIMRVRALEPGLFTTSQRSTPRSGSKFRGMTQDRFFASIEELNSGTSNDLADLLYLTWCRDASEKHDKVFALLSAELLTTPAHGIIVDYDIPWSQLCIQSVRAAMNIAGNLKVLKFAGMARRWRSAWTNRWDPQEVNHLLQHPSWAADWWAPPQNNRAPASFRYADRGVFDALNFCCPKKSPEQSMSNKGPLLSLPGIFLGLINLDQEPTFEGGPTYVHPAPPCANMTREILTDPENEAITVPKVTTYAFLTAVEKHLQGNCFCFPPISIRANTNFGTNSRHQPQPPKLKFSNTCFPVHTCSRPSELKEGQAPAQVLAESVESGDWLVLFDGATDPFVIRPVKDRSGRIPRPHDYSSYDSQNSISGDEGMFVLVGEASMCWDELWPRQWSLYCRACSFVLV